MSDLDRVATGEPRTFVTKRSKKGKPKGSVRYTLPSGRGSTEPTYNLCGEGFPWAGVRNTRHYSDAFDFESFRRKAAAACVVPRVGELPPGFSVSPWITAIEEMYRNDPVLFYQKFPIDRLPVKSSLPTLRMKQELCADIARPEAAKRFADSLHILASKPIDPYAEKKSFRNGLHGLLNGHATQWAPLIVLSTCANTDVDMGGFAAANGACWATDATDPLKIISHGGVSTGYRIGDGVTSAELPPPRACAAAATEVLKQVNATFQDDTFRGLGVETDVYRRASVFTKRFGASSTLDHAAIRRHIATGTRTSIGVFDAARPLSFSTALEALDGAEQGGEIRELRRELTGMAFEHYEILLGALERGTVRLVNGRILATATRPELKMDVRASSSEPGVSDLLYDLTGTRSRLVAEMTTADAARAKKLTERAQAYVAKVRGLIDTYEATQQRASSGSSSSSGRDSGCLERCLDDFCSSRGLSCNAHSMDVRTFAAAKAVCAPRCGY
jgi:hypothetical protein